MFKLVEIALGIALVVFASWPHATLYRGHLGGAVRPERRTPIEPQWPTRLWLIVVGLAAIVDSLWMTFSK